MPPSSWLSRQGESVEGWKLRPHGEGRSFLGAKQAVCVGSRKTETHLVCSPIPCGTAGLLLTVARACFFPQRGWPARASCCSTSMGPGIFLVDVHLHHVNNINRTSISPYPPPTVNTPTVFPCCIHLHSGLAQGQAQVPPPHTQLPWPPRGLVQRPPSTRPQSQCAFAMKTSALSLASLLLLIRLTEAWPFEIWGVSLRASSLNRTKSELL